MKYIDVEKLKTQIEEYENTAIDAYNPLGEDANFWHGKVVAYEDMKEFIDSLQQEQEQYVIGGQVFGATDVNQLYEGKVYIISNLVQDTEFGLSIGDKVKMLLMKD